MDLPDVVTPAAGDASEPMAAEVVEESSEPVKIRESTAIGNERIEFLKHDLCDVCEDRRGVLIPAHVDLAIRNLTDTTVATAVIEVTFFDVDANVLETVRHETTELWPDTSRGIRIDTSVRELDAVKRYDARITKTRTVEQERVQLRRHDINRNEAGEDVVVGVVKNISKAKADAAVVVTFYGANKEGIGRKVVVLRDIEPETIRRYTLTFKPPEGERMGSYSIDLGELA